MRKQTDPEEDRAAVLTRVPSSSMPWRVLSVAPLPGYRLQVQFVDGLTGTVDLAALIASPSAGVFAGLRDVAMFNRVNVEFGAVTWPDEIDLAPDAMHAAIRSSGEWVVPCDGGGPQVFTERSIEAAGSEPFAQRRDLSAEIPLDLKTLLLSDEARGDDIVPASGGARHRPPPEF